MAYLIANDLNGLLRHKRITLHCLTEIECLEFCRTLFPDAKRIYGTVERAPRGCRIVYFYLSMNKQGQGRNGRNWTALAVEESVPTPYPYHTADLR